MAKQMLVFDIAEWQPFESVNSEDTSPQQAFLDLGHFPDQEQYIKWCVADKIREFNSELADLDDDIEAERKAVAYINANIQEDPSSVADDEEVLIKICL